MSVKASSVIGLKVVSLKDGADIEDVNDVIYDPSAKKVKALLVDSGGWFSEAKVIPLSEIKSIGKNAVTVESAGVIHKASELPEPNSGIAESNTKLRKMRVLTESGTDLGRVADITFDPKTGEVQEFEISRGAIEDIKSGRRLLSVDNILTVGKDEIIVKDKAEEEFKRQATKGGAQAEAKKGAEKVEEKTKEAAMAPEAKRAAESFRQATASLAEGIQSRYERARKEREEKRIKDSMGQFLTKTILLPNDEILASRGEMVTHDIIQKAEKNRLLDQVLNNTSHEPLEKKS